MKIEPSPVKKWEEKKNLEKRNIKNRENKRLKKRE